MNQKYNITKNHIIGGIILILSLCILFLFVYKAQLKESFEKKNNCTLMWEHKANSSVELSAEIPSLTQVFTCTVPELRIIEIECKGKTINEDTDIEISLTEPGTGKEYYYKKVPLKSVVSNGKKKIALKLKKAIENSEDKQLILNISLTDAQDSKISLTANYKPGIVTSFDGMTDNKTNVLYSMYYSSTKQLESVYMMLCVVLLLLGLLSYYLIIVQRKSVEHFYIPIALLTGLIFQCVVVVYGVPDEPWHMDTAYKLSNDLLLVEDSTELGVLLKRQCDVVMCDMLANGVESNSYYQLLEHTFEKPENVELVAVSYTDSSNLVPDFIFLPTAVGISIGRLLNLSALLTLQLGRLCNLLVFVLLVWLAIRRIPYGKNVMAALGLTPIAMQQAASASYDPVITGIAFLFIATILRMVEYEKISKKDVVIAIITIAILGIVKGGVYLPLICLVLLVLARKDIKQQLKSIKKGWIAGAIVLGCVVIIAMLYKFGPIVSSLMLKEVDVTDMDSLYSVPYLLEHPLNLIYLYWNTFIESGTSHLAGLLGGKLGWHDVPMSWVFISVIFICLLLLVNVENDKYTGFKKDRICIGVSCLVSVLLIMLSMLFACTTLADAHITGIQGRYYLPLAPALFMLTSNSMVKVNSKQRGGIWLILILIDVMIILQFFVAVL